MPKYQARPKVLIVEDEAPLSEALSELLCSSFRPMAAPNIADAMELIGRHGFSAVLLDLGLGAERGEAILDEVRRRGQGTPVIVVTANKNIDTALACISKGAYDYLTKPFNNEELLSVLGRALELYELRKKEKVLAAWQVKAPLEGGLKPSKNWKGLDAEARTLVEGFLANERPDEKRFSTLVKAVERELVVEALSLHQWNQVQAARWLGINVITLAKRMTEHSIPGIKRPIGLGQL